MPATPYLTTEEARVRLSDYGITPGLPDGQPFAGDLRAASEDLDSLAPFTGFAYPEQEREFPRIGQDSVPDGVLDWVALRALQLSADEEPAVRSEGAGGVRVEYLYGKYALSERRMSALLEPYLLRTGSSR